MAFLIVNLTTSGMNYNPDIEDTALGNFSWFEVDVSTPNPDLCRRKTQTFELDLEVGRHAFNLGHTLCWKSIKGHR